MKILKAAAVGMAAMALTALVTTTAQAQITYNITFSGNQSDANGQIVVQSGLAISGFLDVTVGPNQGIYNLASVTSPLITPATSPPAIRINGTDQIFDDVVTPNSNPFLTDNGLEFANDKTVGFNLWANGPGSYSLFDVSGNPPGDQYIIDNGIATITPAPEPATAALLGIGMVAFALRRRK